MEAAALVPNDESEEEKQSRRAIKLLFLSHFRAKEHHLLLGELKKAPQMAKKYFDYHHPWGITQSGRCIWHPFTHLLVSRAELIILKEAYLYFPDVIKEYEGIHGIGRVLSLWIACAKRSDEPELIQFLADKHPEAIKYHNSHGRTNNLARGSEFFWPMFRANVLGLEYNTKDLSPLHLLMRNRAPKESIHVLLKMNPEILYCFVNIQHPGFFALAWKMYGDEPATELIASTIKAIDPITQATYEFGIKDATELPMSQINRLLDQLLAVKFILRFDRHDLGREVENGWSNFFAALASNTTIKSLSIEVDTYFDGYFVGDSLPKCLRQNKCLESLTFNFQRKYRSYRKEPFLNAVMPNLSCHLKKLVIHGLIVDNARSFHELIGGASNLTQLHIDDTYWQEEDDVPASDAASAVGKNPALKRLQLSNNEISNAGLLELVKTAVSLPSLQELVLWKREDADKNEIEFTEPILHLMAKNKIQKIDLGNVMVDKEHIFEALRRNNSLVEFVCSSIEGHDDENALIQLLEEHNTSLVRLEIIREQFTDAGMKKLTLLLELNRFGRGKIEQGISKTMFVDLLCGPMSAADNCDDKEYDDLPWHCIEINSFNLHYGLLHQSPAIWSSTSTTGTKRRWGETLASV